MNNFDNYYAILDDIQTIFIDGLVYNKDDKWDIFARHLQLTKKWFIQISFSNKKLFLFQILHDVKSDVALSLLLKAIWNCRPKDVVMSVAGSKYWSAFDRVPMDHNRTIRPPGLADAVMTSEQDWFRRLDPELQATTLIELANLSGGPLLWELFKEARLMFEAVRDGSHLTVLNALHNYSNKFDDVHQSALPVKSEVKSDCSPTEALLLTHLDRWNATLRAFKANLKIEDLTVTFKGKKQNVWVMNRTQPESTETVDIIQLLPASLAKKILSYLPKEEYLNYAKVNKYWTYLLEDYRLEMVVKQKKDLEFTKLYNIVHARNPLFKLQFMDNRTLSGKGRAKTKTNSHISLKKLMKRTTVKNQRTKRTILGAADEDLFSWCKNVVNIVPSTLQAYDGILFQNGIVFPCPLMKTYVELPLKTPMTKDPTTVSTLKRKRTIKKNKYAMQENEILELTRFHLWSEDFTGLHKIYKIPSYLI